MGPPFDDAGNLPPGVHPMTWPDFVARYGTTAHRLHLLAGLKAALDALRAAGCRRAYVDGSFVTAKKVPNDYDGCWDAEGVDLDALDAVLLTFDQGRAAQKAKYFGEFFPANFTEGGSGLTFVEFFQVDRNSGAPKGLVLLDLEHLP